MQQGSSSRRTFVMQITKLQQQAPAGFRLEQEKFDDFAILAGRASRLTMVVEDGAGKNSGIGASAHCV
jgi:hypothetical protein